MNRREKEMILEQLVEELSHLENSETYHREFWSWRQKAMRRLSQIFGNHSLQLNHFITTAYLSPSLASHRAYRETDGSKNQVIEVVQRFKSFIATLKEEIPTDSQPQASANISEREKNVFISHSSKDHLLAKEVTNLLEVIGVPSNRIFNSSMPGYGVKPGEDWVETLKTTISSEGVVISLLSKNYHRSAVSLCEMGAAWVLSKKHYPLIIPPLTFQKVKGIIPTKHGIMINDSERWSELKEELEKVFELTQIPGAKWESRKKDILERIEKLLPTR